MTEQSKVNSAIDNFKKHQHKQGGSCNTDSIFNKSTSHGKGDCPRKVTSDFAKNFEDIFPNSYKPSWKK
jgi:hypothetical protein